MTTVKVSLRCRNSGGEAANEPVLRSGNDASRVGFLIMSLYWNSTHIMTQSMCVSTLTLYTNRLCSPSSTVVSSPFISLR